MQAMELDEQAYVSLLSKLIGETERLQNNPPDLIPQEDLAGTHVLDVLLPLSKENGGPLSVKHISYEEGRGNIIVKYPGTKAGKIVSFVGMHLDVVPANREEWDFDPFSLTIDGDRLQGRGTTDCLGHVALVTDLMRQLGEKKPALETSVVAVFIANEETSSVVGIGVDGLMDHGELDELKDGPLFWIDSSDKQPCIGTGGIITWGITAHGKAFHSGFPDKAINPMELLMEALKVIQTRFYKDVPPLPEENKYKFETPSTMKPTQWSYPGGGVTQIPGECTIHGDCRITPFYDVKDIANKISGYVDYINSNIEELDVRGPVSKYVLPDEGLRGSLELNIDKDMTAGVACNLESPGYLALCKATEEVVGYVEPFSVTGSLPLIHDLQDAGYDVQCVGYGLTATYHAPNEYCKLSDMKLGFKVMARIISLLETNISV